MADAIATQIEQIVVRWPGVTATRHRLGMVEFRVGRREIGHIHGDRLADLPFPVRIREQLVAAGTVDLHHVHPESGWVSYYIRGGDDVRAVVHLFRLNYDRPWLAASERGSREDFAPLPEIPHDHDVQQKD